MRRFLATVLSLPLVASGLVAAAVVTAPPVGAAEPGDLVITEIMQNPAAVADAAGEWFEIVNVSTSDVDIEGWTIRDDGTDSHVIANGAPLVVPAGGYVVLGNNADSGTNGGVTVDYEYSSIAIANADDEIVLEDLAAVVIDRVNYDGGPAFPDPTGASMSLDPAATDATSNDTGSNWCEASTSFGDGDLGTPGAINPACPAAPPVTATPGDLVISEIMQNPAAVGDSAGEWFEIANVSGSDVDIDGWTIADNDIDSHTINNGGPLVVPAGGFVVLGNNTDPTANGGVAVDYSYGSSWFLANGADEVVLIAPDTTEFDRVEYDDGATFPDPTGASMQLSSASSDTTSNDAGSNWCESIVALPDGDSGTPGGPNTACPPGAGPHVGELVISEIMQNPAAVGDSAGEWFEIANVSGSDVDIDGWTIADNDSDSHTINNGGPLVVPAGGHLVLGNNADSGTNGGVSVDYSYGSSWFLANGADEVILSDGGTEFDRVEYDGGPAFPDPNGASMNLYPSSHTIAGNDDGANWCESTVSFGDGDFGTPGAANNTCPTIIPPTVAKIHEVQGSGPTVAITGPVSVDAIVTGLFEGSDVVEGFFLQEEDGDTDADTNTSEGIFVYCGACPTTVAVGDAVTVVGNAGEYFGMSQIDVAGAASGSVTVVSSGNPLPSASSVDLPAPGATNAEATFENLEGMLVQFADEMVVSEYFQLARYGQVVLTENSRLYQFTHGSAPSVTGYADHLADVATRQIILDDNNNDQNDAITGASDEPYYYPGGGLSTANYFRGGDTISDLTGILHWSYAGSSGTDAWRIRPVPEAFSYSFTPVNTRQTSPSAVGGSLKVASFNVLNYFTTIDETGNLCGPVPEGCRGADSAAELDRQRAKIVSAITAIDADVVGLIELENNASASLSDLVVGLNAVMGAGTYDYVDTGVIGADVIKVGFIYKPGSVTAVGDFAILDSTVDPAFVDTENRPVLIQTFEENGTGARVTVAVNHLKSKGSACDALGDPDLGDGQGNCNLTRTSAASALADYLATDPTGSGDDDFLIIGDLNSYAMEDPISALAGAGYTNLVEQYGGASAYSYLFSGQLGYLDHALANGALASQITGVTEWHINADEAVEFDYNDDVQDGSEASFERESGANVIYEPSAFRSSDHDPVVVGLSLEPSYDCAGQDWTVPELEAAGYNVILGTASNDILWGTLGNDAIIGLTGRDWITGLFGDDLVCAGGGNDIVLAGAGDDTVDGGPGNDSIWAGWGNDTVFGGPGGDWLVGARGDDTLNGGDGFDWVFGNLGYDICTEGELVFSCEA